jgi:hypothetical protein
MTMTSERDPAAVQRAAGLLLMGSGVLLVALISHHPTWDSGAFLIRAIHGLLMAVILVMAAGFALFVRWRGTSLALVGMVPFVTATAAGFGAGTINGFITPSMVAAGGVAYTDLLWTSNQVLASIGIVAMAAAYAIWSLDLWRSSWRVTALLGLAGGVLPAALLLGGATDMHIGGAIFAYSANAVWAFWLGIMLWRGARQSQDAGHDRAPLAAA